MTGYIKFWTTGDGNVAIDNIQIKNLDKNPNQIEVPFEPAVIKVSDFEYEKPELVFKETANATSDTGALQWNTVFVYVLIGCIGLLIISAIVMLLIIQQKKRGERE